MKRPDARTAYALLVAGSFAAVALWRLDLVLEAGRATLHALERGGPARTRVLGEIALFGAILSAAWLWIPATIRPARDASVAALGLLLGWAAEAWGTRAGIWRYYTGETPPLWIVPAWAVGALLVERAAERLPRASGPWPFRLGAAVVLAVFAAFVSPWLDRPEGWGALLLVTGALFAGASPKEDWRVLAAGAGCVFFADLWGTTNGCWAYYAHRTPYGLWKGILFGMAFDTAVVLAVLKLAKALKKREL